MDFIRRHETTALILILLIGLAVRVPFAFTDFHTNTDLASYRQWARTAQTLGITEIYRGTRVNYPPLLPYWFAFAAWLHTQQPWGLDDQMLTALIKLPSMVADVLTAGLIAIAFRRRAPMMVLGAAAAYLFNPAVWYVSAHWGQTDAVYTLFLVAATLALEGRAVVPTWASYALAIGTKLQSLAIAPLLLVIALTRQRIRPVVLGLATMCGILALLMTPWWLNGRLHEAIAAMTTVHGAPRVDVSAYNLWYLLLLGQVQQASSAAYPLGLPFTFETAGIGLFGILVVIIAALVTTRPAIPLAAAALSLGFFMLLTQTHERYMFPTLAFLAVAAAGRPSLWKIYAVLSATYFFNLITIAPFTPLLGTNLIAAQDDSARTVILKGLSLIAALVNVASLCWIVREMARESQDVITSVQAGTRR